MDKYEALFTWSNEVLAEEHDRFHRIDEKAARYLSALTFLAGAYAFFAQWMVGELALIPPRSMMDWILVSVAALVFLAIIAAWSLTLSVLRIHLLFKRSLNDEMIHFFDDHSMIDIHFALARRNATTLAKNRDVADRKSNRLRWSYVVMQAAITLLAILSALYVAHHWSGSYLPPDCAKL
jgi:hypothetical protein